MATERGMAVFSPSSVKRYVPQIKLRLIRHNKESIWQFHGKIAVIARPRLIPSLDRLPFNFPNPDCWPNVFRRPIFICPLTPKPSQEAHDYLSAATSASVFHAFVLAFKINESTNSFSNAGVHSLLCCAAVRIAAMKAMRLESPVVIVGISPISPGSNARIACIVLMSW